MSMALTNGNHSGALAAIGATPLTPADWEERKHLLHKAIQRDANEAQIDVLIAIGRQYDLDPILKHIDLIEGQVYVTHKGLLHKAHASGQLDGIELLETGETQTHWTARVAVYRRDMSRAFIYPGRYPKNGRNVKYGQEMAITRAECMALRRAFDIALSVQEEMDWANADMAQTTSRVIGIEGEYVVDVAPVVDDAPAALPAPTPLKVEDWPDERLLVALGQGKPEAQVRRLLTTYLGRGTDKETLTDRVHAAKAAAAALNDEQLAQYKALLKELALARATAIGIPPKVTQPAPPLPADDLTAVVGEPEADPQARRRALLWATAAQYGWDEARVRSFGKSLYQSDDLTRWSAAQLDSFISYIRNDNSDQAAV